MLETWELERLLVHLAANESRERRAARRRHHHPNRTEASASRPIAGREQSAEDASSADHRGNNQSGWSSDVVDTPPGGYPASWPPTRGGEQLNGDERRTSTEIFTPPFRAASQVIRAGFASLRLR